MNRLPAFSFAFLFASVSLAAQNSAPGAGSQDRVQSPAVYVVPAQSLDCPVSMHAQHGSGGGLLLARQAPGASHAPNPPSQAPSQQIHLTLKNWKFPGRVVSAKVTVRGTNGKARFVPVNSTSETSAETARALNINLEADGQGQASTEVQLAGFTSVQSITFDSLTFTDGSTWTASKTSACRTAPDPFMLVSAR
jgi:hypothetical protein